MEEETNNNPLALQALLGIIGSTTKPLKYEHRWPLVKGACHQTPLEWHPPIKAAIVKAYIKNRGKHTKDREAIAEIDASYLSESEHNIKSFYRVARELGAVYTPEAQALIESATGGITPALSFKRLTPEEKTQKALDESLDHAERGWAFMGQNDPDELFAIRRRDNLSGMQKQSGDPSQSPYLVRKDCEFIEGDATVYGDRVLVPMHSSWNPEEITGYQTIHPDGQKRFLTGQKPIGQAAFIGDVKDSEVILVCEGWATGQKIYKATGLPVAAALSLGNIHAVAAGLLNLEGDVNARTVLICADTGHNSKMQEVVDNLRAYGFSVKWCKPPSTADNYDFDDQYTEFGGDSVKQIIMDALASNKDPGEPRHKQKFIQSLPEVMQSNQPVKSLIKGFIIESSLNSLTGPTMSYKSFVAVCAAFCIATGINFFGRKTRQANVLYMAGEGYHGLKARFKALLIESGLTAMPNNLYITNGPIDLLSPEAVAMIKKFIIENNIELIVVDTFARCFAADENSARDMGLAIQALTNEIIAAGAAILLVHHTGHGDQSRARGSSSYRAALDVEIGVERVDGGVRLKCWKSKDFEAWPDEAYKVKVIDTGFKDEDNEPVTSLVLERDLNPKKQLTLSKGDSVLWQELQKLKAVSNTFVEDDARYATYDFIKVKNKGQTLQRLLQKLIENGLITLHFEGVYSFLDA